MAWAWQRRVSEPTGITPTRSAELTRLLDGLPDHHTKLKNRHKRKYKWKTEAGKNTAASRRAGVSLRPPKGLRDADEKRPDERKSVAPPPAGRAASLPRQKAPEGAQLPKPVADILDSYRSCTIDFFQKEKEVTPRDVRAIEARLKRGNKPKAVEAIIAYHLYNCSQKERPPWEDGLDEINLVAALSTRGVERYQRDLHNLIRQVIPDPHKLINNQQERENAERELAEAIKKRWRIDVSTPSLLRQYLEKYARK